ncbi:DNA polymerase III, subunit gamma and tau [Eubacterium ruminantium]|nr:DNA polymerase III, subunit gamma and tau [Eubacterium ruminantium]
MSYTALYRKWRPDTFEEVKGQDHIVKTLRNEVIHNRIGHAYLFCGTRGTGKTTIAKLFAKTVNCEHPVDGSPCGECPSCQAIARGNSFNVIEIDAASNNGVDNIRQITEALQYAPSQGKYLVYIIDEVHMLSAGAFNALLKTLEEPPEYVIFILATTEARKVPVTIMSRCQRYDFHRISIETITKRLADLMEREGIAATEDALRYVARAADGSMRDALSILDQCISFNLGEELTFEKVLNSIGAVDTDIFIRLTEQMAKDDVNAMMDIVNEVVWKGRDLSQFVADYIWFFRNMLFLKMQPDTRDRLDITSETADRLTELGESFTSEGLMRYLDILGALLPEIRISTIKRVTLEMALIRMVRPEMQSDLSAVTGRVERLEKKLEGNSFGQGSTALFSGSGNTAEYSGAANDADALGSAADQVDSITAAAGQADNGNGTPAGAVNISPEILRRLIREELQKMGGSALDFAAAAGDKSGGSEKTDKDVDIQALRRTYQEPSDELLSKIASNWGDVMTLIPKAFVPFAKKLKIRFIEGRLVVENDWTEYENEMGSIDFFIRNMHIITNSLSDHYRKKIRFYIRNTQGGTGEKNTGGKLKTKAKIDFPVEEVHR